MDLALNNLQRLICHKTHRTKPNNVCVLVSVCECLIVCVCVCVCVHARASHICNMAFNGKFSQW